MLIGGPHAFESGTFGLLRMADNARFLHNVLRWLLDDDPMPAEINAVASIPPEAVPDLCRVEDRGPGQITVAYVERQLRSNGVLKALSQANWLP